MTQLRRVKVFLALISVTAFLLTSGCGSGSTGTPATGSVTKVPLDPAQLLGSISTFLLQGGGGDWPWQEFVASFGTLMSDKKYTLELRKVTYQSIGGNGTPQTLSGLLILPRSSGSPPAVPILLYQHVTEVDREWAPSKFLTRLNRPEEYPEVVLAAAIASSGYAVVMPDFEGLGDSTGTHPYLHGATLAGQTIDMLRASRDIIAITAGSDPSPCSWNGQLFLMGYSEGGYATMVATRDLQTKHAGEFTVTAAASLSGPHDLSGAMRQVILSDLPYKAPYFIAYLLVGYDYVYRAQTPVFAPANSLASPYSTTIPALFADSPTAESVNAALGMTLNPPHFVTPRSFLSGTFVGQLSDENSAVVNILKENDSYRGWVPAVPIRMMHHPADELVPYANSQAAFSAFSSAGAKRFVTLVPEEAAVDVSNKPADTVHVSDALPELSDGFRWLEGFKR